MEYLYIKSKRQLSALSGSSTLFALFVAALLASAFAVTSLSILTMINRHTSYAHSIQAKSDAILTLIRGLNQIHNPSSHYCFTKTARKGRSEISRMLCMLRSGGKPFWDYSTIRFDSNCQTYSTTNLNLTPNGNPLTSDAFISPLLCLPTSANLTAKFASNANIISSSALNVYSLLASAGYIDLSTINIKRELAAIVAYGDIFIGDIKANIPFALSLISATGKVTVKNSSSYAKIYIYALQGYSIPHNVEILKEEPTGYITGVFSLPYAIRVP